MLITIFVFIVLLSLLVLIHELGHYTAAKLIGVEVEEFGLGLPPRIGGKKLGKTLYSLNWLPIGGFVKLAGEDDEENAEVKGAGKLKYFWGRTKKERSLILVAGVTMNFLLALAITAWLLIEGVNEPSGRVHIEKVVAGSPADLAGFSAGDIIKTVKTNQKEISVKVPKDLIESVSAHKGELIYLTLERQGQTLTVEAVPRVSPPKGEGPLGVTVSDLEIKKYSVIEAPYMALKINLERARMMLFGIADMVWGFFSRKTVTADIAGPIGIAQVTGQAVKFGFRAVLEFMSILSLNLAVLNILPVPALDGGRLAFIFAEKILGRRIKPAFEKQTHQIGMIILLILVLLVSINDIMRLARGG